MNHVGLPSCASQLQLLWVETFLGRQPPSQRSSLGLMMDQETGNCFVQLIFPSSKLLHFLLFHLEVMAIWLMNIKATAPVSQLCSQRSLN